MTVEHIVVEDAPPPRAPYSHATVAQGPTIFISGQGPFTPGDELLTGSFEQQALRTFENVRLVLEGAGASLEQLVRVGIYLRDMSNFAELNELYERFFPRPYPARTCVPVALPRFDLEVDAVAVLGNMDGR